MAPIKSIDDFAIYPDLIRKFIQNGHKVHVFSPLERRNWKNSNNKKEINKVHFVKTLNLTKTSFFEKFIGLILFDFLFEKQIKKEIIDVKIDLILYTTPPITISKLIQKLKDKYNCKTYLLLKDIFPQNAVDLKLINKGSILYKYFRKKETELYNVSDHIGCMSRANFNYVVKNNPEFQDKIEVNPNSREVLETHKFKNNSEFIFPKNKVLFVYGGNLGLPQEIKSLVRNIISCSELKKAFFIIVGEGTEKKWLKNYIKIKSPKNLILLDSLEFSKYFSLLNLCHVGIISLNKNFTIPNYPSRILDYMMFKLPVICATDKNTDIGIDAEKEGYGFVCKTDDSVKFFNFVEKFTKDKKLRFQMGVNGYNKLLSDFNTDISYSIILNHFKNY